MKKITVAHVFSDGCVLQRNKRTAVFGTGDNGKNVKVTFDGVSVAAKVTDGKWKAFLPKHKEGKGFTLTVASDGEEIVFKDVAVGEVWLAGGQSNMEFELGNVYGGQDKIKNDDPDVRFYYTPKFEYEGDELRKREENARWEYFKDNEGTTHWSAVGYMFAKQLSETLGVTVGVIGCNWGGTSASAWMAEEDLDHAEPEVRTYIDEYREFIRDKSLDEQRKEYEEYLAYRADWEPKCNRLYEQEPDIEWAEVLRRIGDSRYPGPLNEFNPMRPCGLYKVMLKKVIEYTLAGVIYYQGESDDHKPYAYYNLFHRLITRWRKDNGDDRLPFLAVQLPMHRYKQDPDFKNWPVIRKAQRKVADDYKNVGIAVGIDCGEWNDIHPKHKDEISRRLALQALSMVYGCVDDKDANGPRIGSVEYKPDGCYVTMQYSDGGYTVKGDKITGFEIAPFVRGGAKEEDYVPAEVELLNDNRIRVYTDKFTNPGSVRYLWTNWGDVTLYGANGLPVEPFRA